jgi:hypothetical protein
MHRLGFGRLLLLVAAVNLIAALIPVVKGGSPNVVFLAVAAVFAAVGVVVIKTRKPGG